ncbi:MAG: hypothetical protein HOH66_03660 [Rhodospirillaceae bacterium]|nr:hypothetical protein [Rhodospirillaceae bacterium]MBT6116939.1 hypothetical protein [Rhodospirillaceae bacterium]
MSRAALAALEQDGIPGAAIYVVMEMVDHLAAGERPEERAGERTREKS